MKNRFVILLGKSLKRAARLRGGGSALPGLVIEKLDPQFLARTLTRLPQGVVLITGTNGKTTTTKITVALLRGQGLRVFTNRSGSNFTRGVASEVLGAISTNGALDADIAVLELDEAHATHFIKHVSPRFSLMLNVMRDQLDRFGEIDYTARLLQKVAEATTDTVVLNRDDPRIATLASTTSAKANFFGAANDLQKLFVNDDGLHATQSNKTTKNTQTKSTQHANDVELTAFNAQEVTYTINGKPVTLTVKLSDVYNFLNAAGALALCRSILGPSADMPTLLNALSTVEPAFGRGETFIVNGQELELTLVKNPGGFRLALSSFNHPDTKVMIAINDNYADGRDMSWLWDVSFDSLHNQGVALTSGVRAYDMALRLQYDEVAVDSVQTNLAKALHTFISKNPNQPKRIFCTYTAMLTLRRELKKYTTVEHAL